MCLLTMQYSLYNLSMYISINVKLELDGTGGEDEAGPEEDNHQTQHQSLYDGPGGVRSLRRL